MREFRDDAGVEWVVFLTARSVARDHHLPEEYREGWLAFEAAHGEKRRIAPVPPDWESLSDRELSALCRRATPQAPRKKTAPLAEAESPESLRPQAKAKRFSLTTVTVPPAPAELLPVQPLTTPPVLPAPQPPSLTQRPPEPPLAVQPKPVPPPIVEPPVVSAPPAPPVPPGASLSCSV